MKRYMYISILCILLIVLLGVLSVMSPLYDVIKVDQNVFAQIGLLITDGGTPYVDLFDHKGPIIYFIYAIGELLNYKYGVFTLQIVNLLISFAVWYKTARLLCSDSCSLFASLTTSALFLAYLEGGAATEEFNLLPISIPLYFYIKGYNNSSTLSKVEYLISGVCIGVCLMTRMNNMAIIAGLALYLVYCHLINKRFNELVKAITFVFVGVVILLLPILCYFYYKAGFEGLYQLYFGTFAMNFEYMANYSVPGVSWIRNAILFAPFVLLAFLATFKHTKDKDLIIPLLLSLLIGITTMGSNMFRHYFVVLVPMAFFAMIILLRKESLPLLVSVSVLCAIPLFYALSLSASTIYKGENRIDYSDADRVFAKMQHKESVYNYNTKELGFSLLQREGYYQCNRVFLPFQLQVSPTLAKQEENSLERSNPHWILLENGGTVKSVDQEYIDANYVLYDSIEINSYPLMFVYEKSESN